MAEEEEVLIALPTVLTPRPADAEPNLVAVAVLTQSRAAEILRQMESVTEQANQWLGVFKLCCFDTNTFYVPADYVQTPPNSADFVVLDPSYTTPEITKLVRLQIGIIPGAVVWEAFDEHNRFGVTTIELSADVLRAVAIGGILEPGVTKDAIRFILPVEPILDNSPAWEEQVM